MKNLKKILLLILAAIMFTLAYDPCKRCNP
jgi:hypothetical protein